MKCSKQITLYLKGYGVFAVNSVIKNNNLKISISERVLNVLESIIYKIPRVKLTLKPAINMEFTIDSPKIFKNNSHLKIKLSFLGTKKLYKTQLVSSETQFFPTNLSLI